MRWRRFAFGLGVHHCLGVVLARQETISTFRELRRRYPPSPTDLRSLSIWRTGALTTTEFEAARKRLQN
jgi:cytochrome P450